MVASSGKIGDRGLIRLPPELRDRFGLSEGEFFIAEERADGILIRPVSAIEVETYAPERKAEFLLNNAVGNEEYQLAREEVQRMGLNPDQIDHIQSAED